MNVWLLITLIHLGSGQSSSEEFLVPNMEVCEEMIEMAKDKMKDQTGIHVEGTCTENEI